MSSRRYGNWLTPVILLLLAGCATSPEVASRRAAIDADIDEILSLSVAQQLGGPKRCISHHQYRGFEPLGDRYMLFEGRRGKLWVNKLRTRCPDLRYGHVFMVRSFTPRRLCDADRFQVSDWFYWPWYRRWRPWHWGPDWGTGIYCALGEFYPVTEGQVAEIESVLEGRWR